MKSIPHPGVRHATSLLFSAGLALLLSACVTVNIYFPAAAAQKLADQVVDQVYKAAQKGDVDVKQGAAPSSAATRSTPQAAPSAWYVAPASPHLSLAQWAGYAGNTVFTALSGSAQAAADLNASSPAVTAARSQVEALAAQMRPYFTDGAVGYTNDGLVTLHDASAVPLAQRAGLPGLISSYNQALQTLYQQIAVANGHPQWAGQIQQTFAQAWVSKAPAGYWYQSASGQWQRK